MLQGHLSLVYSKKIPNYSFAGYTDSDFASIIDDMKNTFGYIFHLGTNLIS
jgi:hypothetical protein